ncbi:hypothetical protein S40288_09887 [Stachybotrys chartarum IBT 40288]|nr:hypothetical protein S40288_09887 [Stachybotrys chartarum IBT 40288]
MAVKEGSQDGQSMPPYVLQDVPGKGKGLVATRLITRGTRILCEKPIVTSTLSQTNFRIAGTAIHRQVKGLAENQQREFFSLHNIHPYKDVADHCMGIFRTNALPIEEGGIGAGIFIEASRINHACDNNAQKGWNERIKRHTIYAIHDIAIGQEITITYFGALRNRKMRQGKLKAKFGFTCACDLCSLPEEQSSEVDDRLEKIFHLDGLIGRHGLQGIMSQPLDMLRLIDRQVCLYNKNGPYDIGLPRAFIDATQVLFAHGDLARAKVFAERALSGWKAIEGSDGANVVRYADLLDNPVKHQLLEFSTKWASKLDEVPQGLAPSDFEDWLWRREKPMQEGQLADLRHETYFPTFVELLSDHELDEDFGDAVSDNVGVGPGRHWCFLGEIIDVFTLMRLQMEVRDASGRKVPIYFYTESRGRELVRSQLQTGHTVAILYAKSHAFMDGQFGIRHEDPTLIKVNSTVLDHADLKRRGQNR